jgi:hypothetical protein
MDEIMQVDRGTGVRFTVVELAKKAPGASKTMPLQTTHSGSGKPYACNQLSYVQL